MEAAAAGANTQGASPLAATGTFVCHECAIARTIRVELS
jgi:hypothetical protein